MDALSHFGVLDELIQVVYQGFERFVVLSSVNDAAWTLYVGLKGPEGRWWRGAWSAEDIQRFIGSASAPLLENFARHLSGAWAGGEMCVGDWVPDEGAEINLTLGPTSRKPVRVPLVELSAKEAASHATTVLSAIALQAQSRKCRLYPPSFSAQATVGPSAAHVPVPAPPAQAVSETDAAQRKIKSLEAELAHAKTKSKSPSSEPEPKRSATRPPKGASLANPHKKARKYREVEFASDDD